MPTHSAEQVDEVLPGYEPAKGTEERSDDELMQALRQDHSIALGILLNRYWTPLVTFVYGYVDSRDAAEDVVQETFMRVWERRKIWRRTGTVRSFLYRVARNLALNESRSHRVRRNSRDLVSAATARHVATPPECLEEDELRRRVESAIASLPERRREIFVLARYHNRSYSEIAQALNIAPQTVANQMSAALATLRENLQGTPGIPPK